MLYPEGNALGGICWRGFTKSAVAGGKGIHTHLPGAASARSTVIPQQILVMVSHLQPESRS